MKFQIGDRVKIVRILDDWENVDRYIGVTGTIADCDNKLEYPYTIKFDDKTQGLTCDVFLEEELDFTGELPIRAEVMECIKIILNQFEKRCIAEGGDNKFALANGSIWTYSDMIRYVEENLR